MTELWHSTAGHISCFAFLFPQSVKSQCSIVPLSTAVMTVLYLIGGVNEWAGAA